MASPAMPGPTVKVMNTEADKMRQEAKQLPVHHTSAPRKTLKKANKRRRQEEATRDQNSSSFSLPPAKKPKTNELSAIPAQHAIDAFLENDVTSAEQLLSASRSEMNFDIPQEVLGALASYEVTKMTIISSSQIQSKVTRILASLASFSFVVPTKPGVVIVHSKGAVSSKLITIIEIAKREIAKSGGKWFQYNGLGQIKAVQKRKSNSLKCTGRRLGVSADAMDVDDEDVDKATEEDESVFETMKTPLERAIEGKPKVRAVPLLITYLSRVRIESLKKLYGEQTNAMT